MFLTLISILRRTEATLARIRTIKPDLFRHKLLFKLEAETGLPIRIAWAGLFTVADREGRFKWDADVLKLDILPFDNIDFSRVLDAWWTRGLVVKYASGTGHNRVEYGWIPTFRQHQVINARESASILPDPKKSEVISPPCSRVDHASGTGHVHAHGEGKGREEEGKGREGVGDARASDALEPAPAPAPFQIIPELQSGDEILNAVLCRISPSAQTLWLRKARGDAARLRDVLADAITHRISRGEDLATIDDWGVHLSKWVRYERSFKDGLLPNAQTAFSATSEPLVYDEAWMNTPELPPEEGRAG